MQLEVCLPNRVLLSHEILKLVAVGQQGCFCVLPRHVDAVAALRPGILTYHTARAEHHLAIDEGVLLKRGSRVTVATLRAVEGTCLVSLAEEVAAMMRRQQEGEKRTREALAGLEARIARGLQEALRA